MFKFFSYLLTIRSSKTAMLLGPRFESCLGLWYQVWILLNQFKIVKFEKVLKLLKLLMQERIINDNIIIICKLKTKQNKKHFWWKVVIKPLFALSNLIRFESRNIFFLSAKVWLSRCDCCLKGELHELEKNKLFKFLIIKPSTHLSSSHTPRNHVFKMLAVVYFNQ